MKHFYIKIISLALCLFLQSMAFGQELEELFTRYGVNEGKGYAQPLADAFGANLNSGWYRSAEIFKNKFQLNIGIAAMAAFVPESQKYFTATTPDYFSPATTAEVPTIFGPTEGKRIQGSHGTAYNFPGGASVNMLPVAVPQLSLGGLLGTEVSIRYFGMSLNDDLGDFSLFGWGVRHSISQYIANFPIHLAVGYFNTRFNFADLSESKANLYGIQASYRAGILELYGGPGYESSNLAVSYEHRDSSGQEEVTLRLEGNNNFRMTVGAALNLSVLKINLDYNLAQQSAVSAGIFIGF